LFVVAFHAKIQVNIFQKSFLRIYEVKNNLNYAFFLSKRDFNQKSGLNLDKKSEIWIKSGFEI
jgi:hypothetical protein